MVLFPCCGIDEVFVDDSDHAWALSMVFVSAYRNVMRFGEHARVAAAGVVEIDESPW